MFVKKIGYARVSTNEQHLDLQLKALELSGCHRVFNDQGISGSTFDRPGLAEALDAVQTGDMLVVWRLDRLGRSLIDLISAINDLGNRGFEFRSLNEAIDTLLASGRKLGCQQPDREAATLAGPLR